MEMDQLSPGIARQERRSLQPEGLHLPSNGCEGMQDRSLS
jgi:hypothetical protein